MRERSEKYQEFVENFKKELERLTEGGKESVVFETAQEKEEGQEDYLVIEIPSRQGKHVQRFHLEELYQDMEEGIVNMEEIVEESEIVLRRCRKLEQISPLDKIDCYEEIRENLIVRPLNYDRNEEKLRSGIYNRVGDIALVVYVNVGDVEGRYTSCMVLNKLLDTWNREKEEVMEAALSNTYRLFPPREFNWPGLAQMGTESYGDFMNPYFAAEDYGNFYGNFVTNTNQCNGAVSVFLPGVAKRLGELIGNDFYIGFTSMHEAVIHDCRKADVETIKASLKGLNEELPSKEDFLSAKVYVYRRDKDIIEVA